MTKSKKRIASQRASKKETRRDKSIYNVILSLMFFFVIHHLFFERGTIGSDTRYALYIVILPMLVGSIIMFLFYFKSYKNDLADIKSIPGKIILTGFYFLILTFGGYFIFAQFAGVAWNYINKETAAKNPEEIFYSNVNEFFFSKNCSIHFRFQNKPESIKVSYQDIEMYSNVSPKRYRIAITAQKGIWNYYIVKHWEIIDKEDSVMNVTQ